MILYHIVFLESFNVRGSCAFVFVLNLDSVFDGGPDSLREGALSSGRCGLLPHYFGHTLVFLRLL